MKRLSLAIGTLLILSTPVLAEAGNQAGPAPKDGMATMAPTPPPRGGGDRWHPMPGPRPGAEDWALRLAERLAGAETLIGIKSDQLDAWRDYTSALIDLFTPPMPPVHPAAGPAEAGADNAFARQEQIAQRMKERAVKADALLQAIAALRAKLTPQQMDRLATIELFPHPPMRGPGLQGRGPMNDGMGKGPMGPGAWKFGPAPHRPDAGGPAGHGPMMMSPGADGGPHQEGPDAMDGGPGPMNDEAPMPPEPDAAGPAPDVTPSAPQQ